MIRLFKLSEPPLRVQSQPESPEPRPADGKRGARAEGACGSGHAGRCRARSRGLAPPCPLPSSHLQTKDGKACSPKVSVRFDSGCAEGEAGLLTSCHHRCLTLAVSSPQTCLQHHCGLPDTTELSPHSQTRDGTAVTDTNPFSNSR